MADGIKNNIFLVNAPAGSGKTTTIRRMVERHLRENPNDNILCVTYTNRAAEELGKDIDSKNVFFGTIHSFINYFVSSFFSHKEVIELYWEIYKNEIQERIENIERKENIQEGNQRYIEKYGKLDAETVYRNIQEISYTEAPYNSLYRGALSHDDLITFTRAVVEKFPIVKRKIRDKYQLVFIDEYQDTSADVLHIFYEAMKGGKGKLYLLGDKMQQIYKTYDGSFEQEFLSLNREMNLQTNYRTTPYIVSILNYIYNDESYEQIPYGKNKDENMSFLPKVIISSSPEEICMKIKQEYPKALVLYLLNRERFYSIGAGKLYEAVQSMEKYGFGRKYGAVDILSNYDEENPDNLFSLLFLCERIDVAYRCGLYGNVIRLIKNNKKILNVSKYTVKQHGDKKKVKELLENVMMQYEDGEKSIAEFLIDIKEMDFVDDEYLDEIIGEEDYSDVIGVSMEEFHNLVKYLEEPHISTQHGVKGESHDTVIFLAANSSRNPVVNMTKFFELWSSTEVNLSEFEKFYYEYKNLIQEISEVVGMKCTDMKSNEYNIYMNDIYAKLKQFEDKYSDNGYFNVLLQPNFTTYFSKKGVTKSRECLRENLVYGPLSAYRLFYVGCSRARKNLCVIINRKDVVGFERRLRAKFEECGFEVTM